VHRGDHRHRQLGPDVGGALGERPRGTRITVLLVVERRYRPGAVSGHRAELGEVQPSAERPAITGQDDRPHLAVRRQPASGRHQAREHGPVQGVELVRPVQPHVGDPVGDRDAYPLLFLVHGHSYNHARAATPPDRGRWNPMRISRAVRDVLYCALGSLAGLVTFVIVLYTILPGLALSVTIVFTVVGLLVVIGSLRLAVLLGRLHRRLLARVLGVVVPPPPAFAPGSGILNRVDRRLRYRPGWRAVWYALIKLPVAAVQAWAVSFVVCGLIDVSYPMAWLLFRNHNPGSGLNPLTAIAPLPLSFQVGSWPATLPAALFGLVVIGAGRWLAAAINAADRRLIAGLLGPSTMAERVSELERTRALAVDDSAAALRRVERDLHDGAQMRLAALALNLGMAQEKLRADPETARELLDAAQRNATDALADLRDIARGIHPPALDNGLAVALESLAASSAIPATVHAVIPERPSPAIETIAYFCAAELMANATKHSYANQIRIYIFSEQVGQLVMKIIDDGIGGADERRGSGLAGLTQRVSTVDGQINIDSPGGGPTVATVTLPLRS
jgi:signal transduction histidine kinase